MTALLQLEAAALLELAQRIGEDDGLVGELSLEFVKYCALYADAPPMRRWIVEAVASAVADAPPPVPPPGR